MFQVPRGTRDFTPDEMQKRRTVEQVIRKTFRSFGYQEIQTPTFETLELFTAKSGESILDEIYDFTDKGGRTLALRPELTAPVMRFYVNKLQMNPKPLKLFYVGSCFRYDRPQKGRYREFQQAGCELIGAATPESSAELIALAYTILYNAGLKNIIINIGNLTIINAMFAHLGLKKETITTILPLIDKEQFDDVHDVLLNQGLTESKTSDFLNILQTPEIATIKTYIKNDKDACAELTSLETIFQFLKKCFHIDSYQLKMSIVRGLDYYKGIVFEIDAPILGAEKQLCGGGAYDLIPLFGGRETPTQGFAIGFDRTLLALEEEQHNFPPEQTDVYIIPVTPDMIKHALELAYQCRNKGLITDIDLLQRGIGKALKHANAKHSTHALIVGPDEYAENKVTIRDMTSGSQQQIALANLFTTLKPS